MYTKLFPGVWNGSLRGKADPQLVFLYLLGNADQDGFAEMIPQKIADDTGLPLERVTAAISLLEAEDPMSRTPDEGGRRIVPIDERGWGWHITNYLKYRNMRDEECRREQNRQAQKRRRQRLSASVSNGQHSQPPSAQAEADTEAHTETKTPIPEWMPDEWKSFVEMRKTSRGVKFTKRAEALAIGTLSRLRAEGHDPKELINRAVESGWRTFYPPKPVLPATANGGFRATPQSADPMEAIREAIRRGAKEGRRDHELDEARRRNQ